MLALFLPAGFIIFLPLDPIIGIGAGALMWLGSWAVLALLSPTVAAGPEGFRAGIARVEWDNVSHVDVITAQDARQAKGVGLDARAWVVIRPWVKEAIRVHISDDGDPTPYWLVSTKQPQRLADVCRHFLQQS